jgi:metallo-beta-lactamase class B
MRTLYTLALILLYTAAQAQYKIEITHLTGNFYIYTTYKDYEGSPFPANGMYLVTDGGAVLFDTPWDSTQFQPLLDSIKLRHGKDAIMSISTHFHADRTAGIDYYKQRGIKTWSSLYTQKLCKEEKEPIAEYAFTKDTTFTIGSYTFQTFYPGNGHAPDNIVLWFPKDKILYGGCFIKSMESKGLGNLSHADPKAWKISAQKTIKQFPSPAYIIPGHGSWQSNKGLQHTLKLLK